MHTIAKCQSKVCYFDEYISLHLITIFFSYFSQSLKGENTFLKITYN